MNMMRKPVSTRVPPVDHMACMTGHGIACLRRRKRPRGPSESTVSVSCSEDVCRGVWSAVQPRWVPRSELGPPTRAGALAGRTTIGEVSSMDTSPADESTCDGSRIAWTVPRTKTTKPTRRAHDGPASMAAPPRSPPTRAPTTPAIETRELARTSVVPAGRSRGTAAARVMV